MKSFLSQNWFKFGLLVVLLLLVYAVLQTSHSIPQDENGGVVQPEPGVGEFDIDISKLNYTLPSYTSICIPTSKSYCENGTECSPMKPTVFILIDGVSDKYYRCDNNPCDEYPYTTMSSGIYTIFRPLPPKQGEIKISTAGDYIETVSLGADLFVSKGTCR